MSFRIGIILPKNIKKIIIEKKYKIKLFKFQENITYKNLKDSERIYQISENGDDSDSGIGSYEICNMTLQNIYKSSLTEEKEMIISDFKLRKEKLERDAEKWGEIIKGLINIEKIERIGIFHFDGHYKNIDCTLLNSFKEIYHKVENIETKDIINIGIKEIHFWSKEKHE